MEYRFRKNNKDMRNYNRLERKVKSRSNQGDNMNPRYDIPAGYFRMVTVFLKNKMIPKES